MSRQQANRPDVDNNRDGTSGIAVSIIVVSWNVRALLRACLSSISPWRERLSLEVFVIDSASADDTVTMVEEDFPWVRLLAQVDNVGFPRGNNIGMAAAEGDYWLLLNPDTELVGPALETMLAFMETHLDVGLLGPQLLNPDGSVQSSRRRFPSLATGFFESTWLQGVAPQGILDDYYARDIGDDETADVDWVMGAALFTRRQAALEAGPMDEDYFMYSEELDWCRRIKDAGWRVVYHPSAQVMHHIGQSSEQAVTRRHIHFQRAKLRYYRRYHGQLASGILRLFLLASYAGQLCLEASKGIVGHKRALRWQRVCVYWQVLRSGLRPAGY